MRSCFLVLLLFVCSIAPVQSQETTIQPGDVVRLFSWADSIVRGEFSVDERGIAILPYIGEVSVTGLTLSALRENLRTRYATEVRDPRSIEITPLRRLSIIGDVARPGVQMVDPTTTLVQAIANAGGMTADADMTRVSVVRDGVATVYDLRGAEADVDLDAVDQVYVARRSWLSRNAYVVMSTALSTTFSLAYLLITIL